MKKHEGVMDILFLSLAVGFFVATGWLMAALDKL